MNGLLHGLLHTSVQLNVSLRIAIISLLRHYRHGALAALWEAILCTVIE